MEIPSTLTDKCVCITGKTKLDRHMLWALIVECGGRWVTKVSSHVDLLVCGDEPGPRKLMEAEILHTPRCTEDELETVIRRDLDYPAGKGTLFAMAWRLPHENKVTPEQRSVRSGKRTPAVVPAESGPLKGKTFVLTGALSRPRPEFEKLIAAAGGKATGSVTKNTDYLVAGEGGGSKRDKAAKLGIPIIGEAELTAMMTEE